MAREDFPFGEDVAIYKVMGKMFALIPVDATNQISLKCDPTFAEVLRQTYAEGTPGWHLNKRHWNDVITDGSIPDDEIEEMIDHSYDLVVKGLSKKDQGKLELDEG
jgi:predicted DNA-binding protein (MmcQ/YjbR family)